MSYTCGFRGDAKITQEEAATVAMQCLEYAAELNGKVIVKGVENTDTDIFGVNNNYLMKVKDAFSVGLFTETERKNFQPQGTLTKGQATAIMNRIADRLR